MFKSQTFDTRVVRFPLCRGAGDTHRELSLRLEHLEPQRRQLPAQLALLVWGQGREV